MSSIFSQIAAGDIPASFVFRDEHWFGILDLYPVTPGHLLLVPNHETPLVSDLPAASLAAMGDVVARASACLYRALSCDAVSVLLRDGSAAGQEIPHVHIHLIPRFHGDDAHNFRGGRYGDGENMVQSAMDDMVNKLRTAWQ
ncbi:MAG: HIT family protein [Planctomycetota bacterium]|jgi:histidine triad (HIT) family protein